MCMYPSPGTLTCEGVAQLFGLDPYGPSYRAQWDGTPGVVNSSSRTCVHPPVDVGVGDGVGLVDGLGLADGLGLGLGDGDGQG